MSRFLFALLNCLYTALIVLNYNLPLVLPFRSVFHSYLIFASFYFCISPCYANLYAFKHWLNQFTSSCLFPSFSLKLAWFVSSLSIFTQLSWLTRLFLNFTLVSLTDLPEYAVSLLNLVRVLNTRGWRGSLVMRRNPNFWVSLNKTKRGALIGFFCF